MTKKDRIELAICEALSANTMIERSRALGVIERITGEECPFTGWAFMTRHDGAVAWLHFMDHEERGEITA